ncbi:carboxymuconolactone decarboxylase family protein [Arcicella aquatica]|uniref:Carboxymuconolactone decarboxylase family protein n=1 Tax=Arcicella aquatica TaxID=217141 RepID=A0ABU5QR67_9BACT|nr:carboxymuconolactone decarboxylase family protein [Arcicella aquatica]MEA5258891.1 carboxymuconolactone decarboxylase family protein [Arcicella aquatica]
MARLTAINPAEATGKTKELFNAVQSKLGVVPNMMRTMGNSPAFLESYLNLSGALSGGTLGTKTGELIALAVSESNSCDYCLSAHTYIGTNLVKIKPEVIEAARLGNSADEKTDGVLKLAKALVSKKGLLSDADVDAAKKAGLTEGEIGEVVGHVALNILTNYFNNTAQTEIDFPVVNAYQLETV